MCTYDASISVTAVVPYNWTIITSYESNLIFQGKLSPIDPEKVDVLENLEYINADRRGKLKNRIGLSFKKYDDNCKSLSPEDEAVHNALLSLKLCGNDVVSIAMIYRAMTKNNTARVTPKIEKMIKKSIERLRKTDIFYDNSASAEKLGQPVHVEQASLITAYVSTDPSQQNKKVYINGQAVGYYVVLDSFALYDWAAEKRQLQSYDIDQVSAEIKKNETTLCLENALLKRVAATGKITNIINYNNLFDRYHMLTKNDGSTYTGSSLAVRESKLKSYICKILDCWTKNGLIEGYQEVFTGRKTTGVEILTQKKISKSSKRPVTSVNMPCNIC